MAAGSGRTRGTWPCGGRFTGHRAVRLKLLKGQGQVVGVGGMPFFSSGSRSRPARLGVVHSFNPADLPARRFQLFHNSFPILRHSLIRRNFHQRSLKPQVIDEAESLQYHSDRIRIRSDTRRH